MKLISLQSFRSLGIILILIFTVLMHPVTGQKKKKPVSDLPVSTTAANRWAGYQQRLKLEQESLVTNVPFVNIGPTIMSGRVVDLEVDPNDPTHFYVAYASGGLWETTNEGASFTPLFDNEIVMTIGDIAVDWNNKVLYVGTGENNSSRSSYAGYGLFKSTDNGKNWEHLGLAESHHIGRVILHPTNPDIIWVASLGHLYSTNSERGIYRTEDGGKTWTKTLFINDQSGIIELIINPENPEHLIAAAWQKDRKAWDFIESGEGSGLYKSTDGGVSWINISEGDNGFPDTKGTGRIGLTYVNTNTIFAVLDNQDRRNPTESKTKLVDKNLLRQISAADFDTLKNASITEFLDDNRFPRDVNAVDLKKDIKAGKVLPIDLVNYLEDANSLLFETEVIGGEVYRSDDDGKNWVKTHEGSIEDFIYSYGYYFGQIRHDASNPDNLYILGVPVLTSADGGKSWKNINGDNVHVDHHALWVNPNKSGHLILGNDGGIHISKDNGTTWIKCNSIPLGQFYYVNVDMAEPYNVYGGLQDNGVWKGPSNYSYSNAWLGEGQYPYKELMGGDGMQVQIDPRDNVTVYTGFQFGNYFRINTQTGDRKRITPSHQLGESPYRWNWQSPILLSKHNPDIVYFGSNRFHRSLNKGDDFETLSGDLTLGGKIGDVAFGTLTTISESPGKFGLLYVGSDDGLIHISKDAGSTWSKITNGLPPNFWVTRVIASAHKESRVYASLNGYRWDHFDAMVYVSEDYGQNWQPIGSTLPNEPVNVIKEDPVNENLLYVGTDHGLYVTLDRGISFMRLGQLPDVAVHDVVVHPRENELIVGTHGRSLYRANVEHLQQLNTTLLQTNLHLFELENTSYSERWGRSWWTWGEPFTPSMEIPYFHRSGGELTFSIVSNESVIKTWTKTVDKGLNYESFDMTVDSLQIDNYKNTLKESERSEYQAAENGSWYLLPGKYALTIQSGETSASQSFEIKAPRERPKRKE